MGAWIKNALARVSLWGKLAGIAIVAALGYIAYLKFKRRGAEDEAAKLRAEVEAKRATAEVAYLEGQKVRNAARLAEIPVESAALDQKIRDSRKRLVAAQARIEGMTDEQLAARFRELGF